MRIRVLTAGILLLLILAGCSNQSGSGTGSTTPFIGGTTGLVIDFQEENPPAEVTDDGFPFNAIVRIENKGEHPVTPSQIKVGLQGFLPSDFGTSQEMITNKAPHTTLEPKRRDPNGNMVDGTTEFITFPSETSSFLPRPFTGNVEVPFRAEMCYKYQTNANGKICVLKDLINKNAKALCNPNGGQSSASSSSPLQITGFREAVTGRDRISFTFDIVHSGSGNLYKVGEGRADADCPTDAITRQSMENQVFVTVSAQGLNNINCDFSGQGVAGYVRLVNGKRTVTCSIDLTNQHSIDYEKVIDITAQFNYLESKDKKILVKHLPR